MKKTRYSASLIVALSLLTNIGWSDVSSSLPSKSHVEVSCIVQDTQAFSHFLGMETFENLKAYHVGLRCLFPDYRIPSAQNLLDSIRSHEQFVGALTQDEALDRFQLGQIPYFVFEEQGNEGHFYIAHLGGLRHFTVKGNQLAGIDNGCIAKCPTLDHLIQATLEVC